MTVSPKLTLKGSSREAKNGLETVSSTREESPRPLSADSAKASATHVVMVSGTVELRLATPFSLQKKDTLSLLKATMSSMSNLCTK